jgi:hypothetical protein
MLNPGPNRYTVAFLTAHPSLIEGVWPTFYRPPGGSWGDYKEDVAI